MKAMVLTGLRKMEIQEKADPELKNDTDVLLKMEAIGVCGSDVHYYTTGRIGSQVVKYPYIIGHECAATVIKVGSEVSDIKIGDHIAVDPAVSCGKCDQCITGRSHTCRNMSFLGTPGQGEGCLCEYIVMPEKSCFLVNPNIPFERVAMIEPLSIGVYSVKLSIPMKNARVGILGCGPIGLSVLMPTIVQGSNKIYVTDKIDTRLETARQAGATWAGNPDKLNIVSEITEMEPLLLDVVFECCGDQEAIDQAIDLLKPGGKLILVGIPEIERISFSIDKIRRKEICIQNVRRQNGCVQTAIDLLESGKINVEFMITHRFDFDKAKDAFDLVAKYKDGVVKAMIILSRKLHLKYDADM